MDKFTARSVRFRLRQDIQDAQLVVDYVEQLEQLCRDMWSNIPKGRWLVEGELYLDPIIQDYAERIRDLGLLEEKPLTEYRAEQISRAACEQLEGEH